VQAVNSTNQITELFERILSTLQMSDRKYEMMRENKGFIKNFFYKHKTVIAVKKNLFKVIVLANLGLHFLFSFKQIDWIYVFLLTVFGYYTNSILKSTYKIYPKWLIQIFPMFITFLFKVHVHISYKKGPLPFFRNFIQKVFLVYCIHFLLSSVLYLHKTS